MTNADMVVLLAVFFAFAVAAWVISVRLGMGWCNPVTAHLVVWSLILLVFQVPGLGLVPLSNRTVVIILTSTVALTLGALGGWLIRAGYLRRYPAAQPKQPNYDVGRLYGAYLAALAALGIYTLIQVIKFLPTLQSVGGPSAVFGGGGIELRRALQDQAALNSTTGLTGGSAALGILGYVLFLGSITIFWGAYLVRQRKRLLGVTPLIIVAGYSLITLQRFSFVYSLVLFLFSYHYHGRVYSDFRPQARRPGRVFFAVMTAILAPVVVIAPVKLRNPDYTNAQVAQSIVTYVASGVGALNYRLQVDPTLAGRPVADTTVPAPTPGLGTYTFWGAASVLGRFGVPLDLPPSSLDTVPISQDGSVTSNVYTDLVYFVYDIGLVGIAIGPLLLGLAAGFLQFEVRVRRRLLALPSLAILMTSITMSFFALSLVRDVRYLFLIVGSLILGRYVLERPHQAAKAAEPAALTAVTS